MGLLDFLMMVLVGGALTDRRERFGETAPADDAEAFFDDGYDDYVGDGLDGTDDCVGDGLDGSYDDDYDDYDDDYDDYDDA